LKVPQFKVLPDHIAIIMDGNGRWAANRGLSRPEGHAEGVKSVRKITKYCGELKIKHLTLFTFSEENWNRPKTEILSLMKLLVKSIDEEKKSLIKNNVKFCVFGNLKKIDMFTRKKLLLVEKATNNNTGLQLNLAISYGARQEIIMAINKLLKEKLSNISENKFIDYLYTKGLPDPDLLIRTSGENRLSNFLLWQIAYTEVYFSNVLWPDFNENELDKALKDFNLRDRRFGKIKENKNC
tara:strand:+ start:803 stop:1519 length:717 start_codon:yes stop_codon:yes gene_type:complete